jgi:hypothetical protein
VIILSALHYVQISQLGTYPLDAGLELLSKKPALLEDFGIYKNQGGSPTTNNNTSGSTSWVADTNGGGSSSGGGDSTPTDTETSDEEEPGEEPTKPEFPDVFPHISPPNPDTVPAVPEPATLLTMVLGLLFLGIIGRKRK